MQASGLPNDDPMVGQVTRQPGPMDILCGKGKLCVGHLGSRRFRAVIESYRHRYSLTKTKYQKMMITKEIYDCLNHESCRFLKLNEDTMAWEELSPMAARDKVGHALRFANRKKRRKTKNSDGASSISSLLSEFPLKKYLNRIDAEESVTFPEAPPTKEPNKHSLCHFHHRQQEPVVVQRGSRAKSTIDDATTGRQSVQQSIIALPPPHHPHPNVESILQSVNAIDLQDSYHCLARRVSIDGSAPPGASSSPSSSSSSSSSSSFEQEDTLSAWETIDPYPVGDNEAAAAATVASVVPLFTNNPTHQVPLLARPTAHRDVVAALDTAMTAATATAKTTDSNVATPPIKGNNATFCRRESANAEAVADENGDATTKHENGWIMDDDDVATCHQRFLKDAVGGGDVWSMMQESIAEWDMDSDYLAPLGV